MLKLCLGKQSVLGQDVTTMTSLLEMFARACRIITFLKKTFRLCVALKGSSTSDCFEFIVQDQQGNISFVDSSAYNQSIHLCQKVFLEQKKLNGIWTQKIELNLSLMQMSNKITGTQWQHKKEFTKD